jgi:hypothetical protein
MLPMADPGLSLVGMKRILTFSRSWIYTINIFLFIVCLAPVILGRAPESTPTSELVEEAPNACETPPPGRL